jgi:pilus assembly protein TadC
VIIIVDIIHKIARSFPYLQNELRIAHLKFRPEEFIRRTIKLTILLSSVITIFVFFIISTFKLSLVIIPFVFLMSIFLFFFFLLQAPKSEIKKRARELDREVLFAGRFLLVKLNSGRPLINALYDASHSYGISNKYFKEIVDDITMGTPIEKAIENAIKYTSSEKFRKILFHIGNAIKLGVDVSGPLSAALDEISKEQMVEIQRYSKKLSSLSMFYMLLAVIMPSLGMAMLVVIGSLFGMFGDSVSFNIFAGVIIFLVIIQLIFISIFKANRVSVNL